MFWVWFASLAVVAMAIIGRGPPRLRRPLNDNLPALVGAWAAVPAIVLFFFYARMGNMVTRYATDMFPALAAGILCVGMTLVREVRERAPSLTASAQLALTAAVGLYVVSWQGWVAHLSHPVDRAAFAATLTSIEGRSAPVAGVPSHFRCGEAPGPSAVEGQLGDWHPDCTFASGMVFAMPYSRCVEFTFTSGGPAWTPADESSLGGFRATADSDALVRCAATQVDGDSRRVTMCEPHPPPYLLDGMRLYSVATLNPQLEAIDRLKLLRIDAAASCP